MSDKFGFSEKAEIAKDEPRKPVYKTAAFWISADNGLFGTSFGTNKVAEAFFGIFALYVLIEFGNFETTCDMKSYSSCAGDYIVQSGETDSEYWLRDCGAIVADCDVNPFILEAVRTRMQTTKTGSDPDSKNDLFDMPGNDDSKQEEDAENIPVEVDFFGIRLFQRNVTSEWTTDGREICELAATAEADKFSLDRCTKLGVDEDSCYTSVEGNRICDIISNPCFTDDELANCSQVDVSIDNVDPSISQALDGQFNEKAALPKLNLCSCFKKLEEFVVVDQNCQIVGKLYALLLFGVTGIVLSEISSGEDGEEKPNYAEYIPVHMSVMRVIVLIFNIGYFVWLYVSFVQNSCNAPEFVNVQQNTEIMAVCALVLTLATVFIEMCALLASFLTARYAKKAKKLEG